MYALGVRSVEHVIVCGLRYPNSHRSAEFALAMAASNTLLPNALLYILSSLALGPSYYEADLPHTTCGSFSFSTARVVTALLTSSPNPHRLVGELWLTLVGVVNGVDSNGLDAAFHQHQVDKSGYPITVSLVSPWTWESVAANIIRPSAKSERCNRTMG